MPDSASKAVPLRQVLGALALDLPRTLWALRPAAEGDAHAPWTRLRNRRERLQPAPAGRPGVACDWLWTSDLHVARALPWVGRWILRRALATWPIGCRDAPAASAGPPQVAFVIGHRGRAREAHLLLTLTALAAQEGASIECIVVEQGPLPEVRDRLPGWVRYQHTPVAESAPYNRAWALNVGARLARAPLLIFHDNDMLVPRRYAAEHCRWLEAGFEVMNLKRLIFYLGQEPTEEILAAGRLEGHDQPNQIMQNAQAGGSLAITAEALEAIGGLDEGFSGWGGEDNEFWERACTRRVWPWGYLPLVHLWHVPQPEKRTGEVAPGQQRYRDLTQRPTAGRIADLRAQPWGHPQGPQGPVVA